MLARTERRTRTAGPFARTFTLVGRSEAGMTLVELMVAISLIAIIMSGLALSIGVDYKAVALARARQVAESAANQRLEQLRDVDYASMALDSQPVHSTDSSNPDYYVNGASNQYYDIAGTGTPGTGTPNETLIVNSPNGPVKHVDPTSTTIGTTVIDIYEYVTWVDDPAIPGTQNLKRLSVVVKYQSVPTVGNSKILRESVVLTDGTVTLPNTATTTTTSTTTTTTAATPTTTLPAGTPCGTFSIAGSSGGAGGYTASRTITITMALSGCSATPGPVLASFADNGGTWGGDVTYNSASPTFAFSITSTGDGTKTISGRVRDGSSGTYSNLASRAIILDTTLPTTPGSYTRAISCSGNNRAIVFSWSASTDTYLTGYHIYANSGGSTYSLLGSTASLSYTVNDIKTTNATTQYKVAAYDAAGNESSATTPISVTKNLCA